MVCSIGAEVFVWSYCVVTFFVFCWSVFMLFKFMKHFKNKRSSNAIPKILFYPGAIMFVFSSVLFLICSRHTMFICYHGDAAYTDFDTLAPFLVFYAIQMYQLWLVLFLRLFYVFRDSAYKLSKCQILAFAITFVAIPLFTPLYCLFLWYVSGIWYTVLLFLSFVFIILFSLLLSIVFVSKLIQVYSNMNPVSSTSARNSYTNTPRTSSNSSSNHSYPTTQTHTPNPRKRKQKNIAGQQLLSAITKNALLACISLSITVFVPTSLLFGYYTINKEESEESNITHTMVEAAECIFAALSLLDVFTNYLCIAFSYNCFDAYYTSFCGCCDVKCKACCVELVNQYNLDQQNKPIEVRSVSSRSSYSHASSVSNVTNNNTNAALTIKPCGENNNNNSNVGGEYAAVDDETEMDEYEDTMTMTTTNMLDSTRDTLFETTEMGTDLEFEETTTLM